MSGSYETNIHSTDINDQIHHGKFRSVVTVAKNDKFADFNCADYNNDDAACIQAAIDYCAAHSIIEFWIFDGTYIIGTQLTGSSNINVHGFGNVTFVSNSLAAEIMSFSGSEIISLLGSVDVVAGATAIQVTDTSNINPDDLVLIFDSTIWGNQTTYTELKTGEMHEVLSVDIATNTINFIDELLNNYSTENGLAVLAIRPISVSINNINFLGTSDTTSNGLVKFLYSANCDISNCIFDKGGARALKIQNSYLMSVSDCKISNCLLDGTGYGIAISDACAHVSIHDNQIEKCRHCISAGGFEHLGEPRDIDIYDNNLFGGGLYQPVDAHGCVESIHVHNNIIHGNGVVAFISGAKISSFDNNIVYGCNGAGTRDSTKDMIFTVSGNEFHSCGYGFYAASADCTIKRLNFVNNQMYDGKTYMAYIQNVEDLNFQNNYIDKTTTQTGLRIISVTGGIIKNNKLCNISRTGIYLTTCSGITISENTIKNCNIINSVGDLYESGISLVNSSAIKVINNDISDSNGYQRYCIKEYGTSDNNTIRGNDVSGASIAQISKLGAATIVEGNIGYTTENTGTATLLQNTTSITVPHGLAAAPTRVQLTPTSSTQGIGYYIPEASKTATTFTITMLSPPTVNVSFDWEAIV